MIGTAGVDYSMTSPAVCLFDGHTADQMTFDNCQFHYLTTKKKYIGTFGNIHGHQLLDFQDNMRRYDFISDWSVNIIGDREVSLEGYAMGAKGKVFNIAENTMLLKYKLWKRGNSVKVYQPTTVKLHACGKGRAQKDVLNQAFIEQVGVDVKEILSVPDKQWNPSSDIIDAYFIAKCLVAGVKEKSEAT